MPTSATGWSKRIWTHAAAFVVATGVLLTTDSGAVAGAAPAKIKVVATTSMIADAANAIGGERVEVTALMGPGVDPHTYRQTRSDIVALVKADVVFWNGLYLEAQLEEFLGDLGKRKKVFAVGEAVPPDQLISHKTYAGRFDPHVWMDPDRWKHVVLAVRDRLIELSPDDEALFQANADAYLKRIAEIGVYAREALATVREGRRVLLTAHDAFNYFGNSFGYEVIGIQGISTESEAGLSRIRAIVEEIVARKISAVFVETSVADRNVRAVIEGAAALGHQVTVGGELFSDAMGQPGTYEGTYVGMIDHNVTTITRALGGSAPERGMAGLLTVSG
ncbi:MAG: manganese transporter [Alphaproteobacteria bacterium BRH_c36]|nr:MAG: manganese transporter [Alphaproteobacteria bacterium BRH_c36]